MLSSHSLRLSSYSTVAIVIQLLKGHKVDASTAKSISDKKTTTGDENVTRHLDDIFAKIGRAARKGETYIHHKFHRYFGGVSQKEKALLLDELGGLGYSILTARHEDGWYRIAW